MSASDFDCDAWIDALAPVLGFAIAPEWRPTIAQNLRVVATMAQLVLEFPLPDEAEPAPVYEPGR